MLAREPVMAVLAAIVAILAALEILGVIDASASANIVAAVTAVAGGLVARSKVTPVE